MNSKSTGSLPLTFLLAMSAEASAAALPDSDIVGQTLQAGMLTSLVRAAVGIDAPADPNASGDRRLPGEKTAQFFPNFPNFPNFLNCFNGTWRNC